MKNKIYIKDCLVGKKIFGISILIFGVCCVFSKHTISISLGITIFIIGIVVTSQRGIEVNLEKNRLREFMFFLGLKFGYWVNYKKPEYISVFKMKYTNRRGNKTGEILNVNLFDQDNHRLTICKSGDLEDAFEKANFLKSVFDVNILDATESESKWI